MDGKYDLIGDIHGDAEVLRRLLRKMQYLEVDGVFWHPDRRVIFVGDFVDRGPDQLEVLADRDGRACAAWRGASRMGSGAWNGWGNMRIQMKQ